MQQSEKINRRSVMLAAIGGVAALAGGCSSRTPAVGPTPARPGGSPSGQSPEPPAQPSASPSPARPGKATPNQIISRAGVPVLCYHQLRNWTSQDNEYARAVLICPPTNFRRQLDAIKDDGWTTISPDDYYAHLTTGRRLPSKAVILSFDDGTIGQVTEGMKQLVKRAMTGTFFPMTVVLGKSGWMTTKDVKRLADAGMTIGAHTWDHHPVTTLKGKDWKIQLDQPRETLRKASGQQVDQLAYPYGSWNRAALSHVAAAGYRTAYQLDTESLDPHRPLLTLRRTMVTSSWSGAQIVRHLHGMAAG